VKKLALVAVKMWLFGSVLEIILVIPVTLKVVHAAEFFCYSGDVNCLIDSINSANGLPEEQHIINLESGSYTLQTVDNGEFGVPNGLPVITSSIRIQGSSNDLPTVIERDLNAPPFRIFEVSADGELTLDGIILRRGGGVDTILSGSAIFNLGVTSLHDSRVMDSITGGFGTITNGGTLRVIRSIISHNRVFFTGGGINNGPGGNVLVENSTISHNFSQFAGGIFNSNRGSLIVKNSSIIFNDIGFAQPGGGIVNVGSAEIINTTIAKNRAGGVFDRNGAGAGVWNSGQISIINSTIRENEAIPESPGAGRMTEPGAGITNIGGTVRIQNTIVEGNVSTSNRPGQDCFGTIMSLGNNLVGDLIDCPINLQPSDLTGEPGLGSFVEEDLPGRAFYPVLAGNPVIERGNPNACLQSDQLGNLRVGICDIGAVEFQGKMLVSVDVRPRSDANRINPNSTKNINVAIFSNNGFDATTVDSDTVRFGATGIEAAPIHVALRDVNKDGHPDMVVRFQIQNTGISCGNTSATLTGQISGGASIIGSSPIRTVQCGN
jgi:hypothetical protein